MLWRDIECQLNILFFFVSLLVFLQIVVWSVEEERSVYEEEWKSTYKQFVLHNVLGEPGKKTRFLILLKCQRDLKGHNHGAEEDTDN